MIKRHNLLRKGVRNIENITLNLENGETKRVSIYNVDDFPYFYAQRIAERNLCTSTRGVEYINLPISFDIEASTVKDQFRSTVEQKNCYLGFMYVWQFCYNDCVVMGRTWEEFLKFLDCLQLKLNLSNERRLVIYVHYLAYEFQFIRNFIEIENVFARKKRVPMKVQFNNGFEFRCSYFLSNMSLDKFIKNTPGAIYMKQSGDDFDYHALRLPNTVLSESQLGYCYCDVRGLAEAIAYLLKEDTIATIPLTSTGFLRRDVRKAVLSNKNNISNIQETQLTPSLYVLCKTASRGGNTHANAIHSNQILYDLKSKDRKSSYPAEMVVDNYPVTKFRIAKPTESNLLSLTKEYACLLDITLYNVSLKRVQVMPYISFSKCISVSKIRTMDNGRITHCEHCSMVCTDVDFNIIQSQYNIESYEVRQIYVSTYGKLNNEFRNLLMEYFKEKCRLENGDKYLYGKFKNKINAFFGMMLTDICNPDITYQGSTVEPWSTSDIDLNTMLTQHYKKRNTFLSYQHGVWVTANARYRLQQALDIVDSDGVYCDTDSVKYMGDYENEFKELNEQWLETCDNNDIKPYVTVNGKTTYLGTWENDGDYLLFKTLGAKKYAYTEKGDINQHLHITVAGLSKKKGAEYLDSIGGIKEFKIGTVVPKTKSGRTVAYYNDETEIKTLTINGCTFTTSSNVAVIDAEYTFGISDDYYDYLATFGNNENNDDVILSEIKERIENENNFQTDK